MGIYKNTRENPHQISRGNVITTYPEGLLWKTCRAIAAEVAEIADEETESGDMGEGGSEGGT